MKLKIMVVIKVQKKVNVKAMITLSVIVKD